MVAISLQSSSIKGLRLLPVFLGAIALGFAVPASAQTASPKPQPLNLSLYTPQDSSGLVLAGQWHHRRRHVVVVHHYRRRHHHSRALIKIKL